MIGETGRLALAFGLLLLLIIPAVIIYSVTRVVDRRLRRHGGLDQDG